MNDAAYRRDHAERYGTLAHVFRDSAISTRLAMLVEEFDSKARSRLCARHSGTDFALFSLGECRWHSQRGSLSLL
jgi:hypothetical protein